MKLNKQLLVLFGALILGSCSKDLEPAQSLGLETELPSSESGGALGDEVRTETLRIDMDATQDDEELRAIYNLTPDGGVSGLAGMVVGNPELRVFIRRLDEHGKVQATTWQDLTFTKDPSRNYATYSGDIRVPAREKMTDTYAIAAVLMRDLSSDLYLSSDLSKRIYQAYEGGGAGVTPDAINDPRTRLYLEKMPEKATLRPYLIGPSFSSFDLLVPDAGLDKLYASMPYITNWQLFPRSNTQQPTKLTLVFRPAGTLLRLRVKNNSTNPLEIASFGIRSNAFVSAIIWNFADETTQTRIATELLSSIIPTTSVTESRAYRVPAINNEYKSITVAPGAFSPWYYTLVFSTNISDTPYTRIGVGIGDPYSSMGKYVELFDSEERMSDEKSVAITMNYPAQPRTTYDYLKVRPTPGSASRPAKLALDYVAEGDFSRDYGGNTFYVEPPSYNSGHFTYEEAVRLFSDVRVINGKKYSIPTREEMASIFPPYLSYYPIRVSGTTFTEERTPRSMVERNVKIGSTAPSTYLTDYYWGVDHNVIVGGEYRSVPTLYAIRFQDATDQHRTAFRYRHYLAPGGGYYLEIQCLWLGASTHTIQDIVQDSFWSTRRSEVVSRRFYPTGFSYGDQMNERLEAELSGALWTSTPVEEGGYGNSAYAAFLPHLRYGGISPIPYIALVSKFTRLPVRPFIRD